MFSSSVPCERERSLPSGGASTGRLGQAALAEPHSAEYHSWGERGRKEVEREEGRENRKRGEGKVKGGKGEREKEGKKKKKTGESEMKKCTSVTIHMQCLLLGAVCLPYHEKLLDDCLLSGQTLHLEAVFECVTSQLLHLQASVN